MSESKRKILTASDHKGKKIAAILNDFSGSNLANKVCIDIGCGNGLILKEISRYFKHSIGIEIDWALAHQARIANLINTVSILNGNGLQLPVKSESVDLIVCAQVYEHVNDHNLLVNEIRRILRPGGMCFFSGPNKLIIVEEHYWLPFLSWLPAPLANLYMRLFRRGARYDIHPLSYWKLRKLWNKFEFHDYTTALLKNPETFFIDDHLRLSSYLSKLPLWLLRIFNPIIPNFNWILTKPR